MQIIGYSHGLMVEVRGVEPLSEIASRCPSTRLVSFLLSSLALVVETSSIASTESPHIAEFLLLNRNGDIISLADAQTLKHHRC